MNKHTIQYKITGSECVERDRGKDQVYDGQAKLKDRTITEMQEWADTDSWDFYEKKNRLTSAKRLKEEEKGGNYVINMTFRK
jgi:hypothetical protein